MIEPVEKALKAGLESHDWGMFESLVGDVGEAVEGAIRIALETLKGDALGRVAQALMLDAECGYPVTQDPGLCVCSTHGELFEGMTVGDLYGHIAYMGGVCLGIKPLATAVVTAMFGEK